MLSIIREFKNRGGLWFFSSGIFDKLIRVSLTFFLIDVLTKSENGLWSIAMVIASTFIPIKSLGIESGILQYASGLSLKIKKQLFKYVFQRGLGFAVGIGFICASTSYFLNPEFYEARPLIYILSFWLPCYFVFELLLNYTRVIKDHKVYAKIQSTYNITFVILIVLGYITLRTTGIAFAFTLAPLITFLIFFPDFLKSEPVYWKTLGFRPKHIIWYGFKSSLSNYASTLLFYLDVWLIEYFLNSKEALAEYRTATVIPLNLSFFAIMYINNDYVHLVEHKEDRSYLKSYLKKYFKVYILFTVLCLLVFYPFSDLWWDTILFSGKYIESKPFFEILLLASVCIILLRIPAGNMLSAVGLVHINTNIAYLTVILNLVISISLFPIYGLFGIAYGTVISLALSGAIAFLFLLKYLNKEDKV